MVNTQEWLDKNYPCNQRKFIKELKINDSYEKPDQDKLEGSLNLNDFTSLEKLNCSYNKLISLNVSNCYQLTELDSSSNLLTNITLPVNPTNLKILKLYENNFSLQNLSFLSPYTNLEEIRLGNWNEKRINQGIYNRFTGSLDYLSGMKKLKRFGISNTDVSEVDYTKLPNSLSTIWCSTKKRPNCKLTSISPLLEGFNKYGWCSQCRQINTSRNWCRSCAERDIKKLSGQVLVKKIIGQQRLSETYEFEHRKLKWIPYEEFTEIEYLAEGGFSKIYKAYWRKGKIEDWNHKEGKREVLVSGIDVALKVLNNSQNITLEFLQEIANTKLADYEDNIVKCYGVSQNPETSNYLMVIQYIEEGNLRNYLKNKAKGLSWEDKISKLHSIASGLNTIHQQGLMHRDFHSGNILSGKNSFGLNEVFITDFGLSQRTNSQPQEDEIFGVIPYVAPEVLQGKPYTQKADVYSFGIIAYEICSGSPPYRGEIHDLNLILSICRGLRPQFQIKIPKLLEDLIECCWEDDPLQRPDSDVLKRILLNWCNEWDTEFIQQITESESYNETLPEEIKYPNYQSNEIWYSKTINTKQITELLHGSKDLELDLNNFNLEGLSLQEGSREESSAQAQIQIPPK